MEKTAGQTRSGCAPAGKGGDKFCQRFKTFLAKKFLGSHRFFATVDFSMYVEGFFS
jgi:hypothetical protein